MESQLPQMHDFFIETSQMIVAVHHTYVHFRLSIGVKKLVVDVEDIIV